MFWIYDYVKTWFRQIESLKSQKTTPTVQFVSLPRSIEGSDKWINRPKDHIGLFSLKEKEDLKMMLDWWMKGRIEHIKHPNNHASSIDRNTHEFLETLA